MRLPVAYCLSALAPILAAAPAHAVPSACDAVTGNLVSNCGFETNGGWTGLSIETFHPHTGDRFTQVQAPGTDFSGNVVSQTIATTPGQDYSLTFYDFVLLGRVPPDAPSPLTVTFGSQSFTTTPTADWSLVSQTVTATTSSTVLSFAVPLGAPGVGYGFIDDVVLVPARTAQPVPEPVSAAIAGAGLAALAAARRRRR